MCFNSSPSCPPQPRPVHGVHPLLAARSTEQGRRALCQHFEQLLHRTPAANARLCRFEDGGCCRGSQVQASVSALAQLPAGAKLQVQAVLTCSDSATSVPDWIASQYREPIALGARARLKQQPAREFTDLNGAVLDAQRFEAAIGSTPAQVYQGHTSQTPRKRPNWF